MTWELTLSFTVFSIFLFYQQLHVKNFSGSSQGFAALITFFSFAAMIGGLIFLGYFGYKVSWLGALGMFAFALVAQMVWFGVEAAMGLRKAAPFLSLAGFVAIPAAAYCMWVFFPRQ